jgi:2-hydroxyacyl-CoA lyase 1
MQQMNAALGGRQWFHPKESQWRQMIAKKTAENVETIKPLAEDDTAPGGYYRLLRDIAQWMPRNSVLSAEGAGTMDIGLTMLPSFNARHGTDVNGLEFRLGQLTLTSILLTY